MVYLHSYFNRKSRESLALSRCKDSIKLDDMKTMSQYVDKKLTTREQISRFLTIIDDIQRLSNAGLKFQTESESLISRLIEIGFSQQKARTLFNEIKTLAQHRNTFFSQTKWNWFGLNRTNGIIQLKELLEQKSINLPSTGPKLQQEEQPAVPNLPWQPAISDSAENVFENWTTFPAFLDFETAPKHETKPSAEWESRKLPESSNSFPDPNIQTAFIDRNKQKPKSLEDKIVEQREHKNQMRAKLNWPVSPAEPDYFDLSSTSNTLPSTESTGHSQLHALLVEHQKESQRSLRKRNS